MPEGDNSGRRAYARCTGTPSRRQMLTTLGALGSAALAGCSGDSGGPETDTETTADSTSSGSNATDTGSSDGEPVTTEFQLIATTPPEEVNMWPFNEVTDNNYALPAYTRYGMNQVGPYIDRGEFNPLLLQESKLVNDNQTWRIKLSDKDFTWHNGEPVTIDDQYLYDKYWQEWDKKLGNQPDWKAVRKVDDQTLERDLHERALPAGFFHSNRRPNIFYPRWHVREWYEKMTDATTAQEAETIHKNAQQAKQIPMEDFVGHGMFQVDDVRDNEVIFTKYEDHPNADKQNIETVRTRFKGSDSGVRLAFKNDQVDFEPQEPNPDEVAWPDDMEFINYSLPGGNILILNQHNPHLAKRGVRRALAYMIDFESLSQNTRDPAPTEQVGAPKVVREQWLPDYEATEGKWIDYGMSSKPDQAAQELQNAGYTRENGTWVDENGENLTFKMRPLESTWRTAGNTLNSQFRQHGIEVDNQLVEGSQFWSGVGESPPDERQWEVLPWWHGASVNHPAHCYRDEKGAIAVSAADGSVGWGGRDAQFTMPSELGQKEVSGSGKDIDLRELQKTVTSPDSSIEETKQATQDLMQYWNWDVPNIMFNIRQFAVAFDTANFTMPDSTYDDRPDAKRAFAFSKPAWTAKTK